MVSSKKYRDTT